MSLEVSVVEEDSPAVLELVGELDMGTAPNLIEAARARVDAGVQSLVLDLAKLTFCDSAGLRVFIQIRNWLTATGGTLVLVRPTRIVQSVLDLTGLVGLIPVQPTVSGARAVALN